MKAHVSEVKKKEVEIIKNLMSKYKVVGIIDLTEMPSPQLQVMRKKLKDSLIRVTKKRLIKIALEELKENKKGIEKLEEVMRENVMPCLILTNEDSFKLAKVLRKAKTAVAAKAGQIAPQDLIIKAGPTPFAPGPIIGEFGMLGVKAAVEGGKIVVKQDKVLVKEGEEINAKAADMLGKLGIEPMQIGLNLVATFDNNVIFKKDVLDVDDKWYIDSIKLIANDGFKLAVEIGYMTKETIKFLISKAEREAKAIENSKKEEKIEEPKEEVKVEIKKEPKEEIKVEIKEEPEKETLKKEIPEERKPSAEEIVKEVIEDAQKEKIEEEKKKKEEEKNRVPTARELAEKKKEEEKKEPEKVPSAAELVEKKKEKENES